MVMSPPVADHRTLSPHYYLSSKSLLLASISFLDLADATTTILTQKLPHNIFGKQINFFVSLPTSTYTSSQSIEVHLIITQHLMPKKWTCRESGCKKWAQKGGVCMTHGAKVTHKRCSAEGCTNQVQTGGVCKRHGAKVKQCSIEGCSKQAQKGEVCIRHGAKVKVKQCSKEGCTNIALKGGLCRRHGEKGKRCSSEGCTNIVVRGGVCIRHGATKTIKQCSSEGCTNIVKSRGVCSRHGATVKRCNKEGCTNQVQRGGVCKKHGAKVKQCSHDGCTNQVKRNGVCTRHGAYKRTSPDEVNQQGDEINPPLPPLPAVELRDEAPKPKRQRTSAQSKRTRITSPQSRRANASVQRSPRVASKRKAARGNAVGVDQDTSTKRRRKSNNTQAAAETLLSFATTSKTVNTGESTYYDEDNVDSFQLDDDSTTVGTEPQDLVKVSLESLPAVTWDDSSLSSSPSISKFLTIEEVNN
eukprot:scaffold6284_cov86-Skeletonema_marinoi.AAC.6